MSSWSRLEPFPIAPAVFAVLACFLFLSISLECSSVWRRWDENGVRDGVFQWGDEWNTRWSFRWGDFAEGEKKELLKNYWKSPFAGRHDRAYFCRACSRQPLAKIPSRWKPRISVILGSVALQSFDPPQLFGPCTLQQCTAIFVCEVLKRKHALFQFRIPGHLAGKTLGLRRSKGQSSRMRISSWWCYYYWDFNAMFLVG